MANLLGLIFVWKRKLTKKQRLYLNLIVGAILVVFVPLAVMTLMQTKSASAAWFDDLFAYRQAVTVTVTSSASDITNLQTRITVSTSALISASKLQSNCQDLRFTSQSGKLLPYFIDSGCNTTTTKIWVQTDLVPKNTTTYTMYMYYGNPTAIAGSNANLFSSYNGLIAYFPMNESSWNGTSGEVKDASFTGNNGTAGGGVTTISGQFSRAGSFDGVDDFIALTSVPITSGSFTISAWIYPTSANQLGRIYSQGGADILFRLNNGVLTWITNAANEITTNFSPPINQWTHVVLTDDTSAPLQVVYANGVRLASHTLTTSYAATAAHIGNTAQGASTQLFTGSIDDFRIYNRALSAPEVAKLYTATDSIQTNATTISGPTTSFATEEKTTGPVAYWGFDEGTGATAKDGTANANNGALGPATTNLILNPTFESDVTNVVLASNNGGSISSDATFSQFGTRAIKWATGTVGGNTPRIYSAISGSFAGSTTYTYSFYAKADTAVTINTALFQTGVGGTNCGGTGSFAVTTSWQRFSATVTTTASCGTTAVGLAGPSVNNTNIYIDGIQVEQSSGANIYCDGLASGGGAGYRTYAWSGTANASASSCNSYPAWQAEDQSISGKSLYFDGTDYVSAGNPSSGVLDFSGDFSVGAWVRSQGTGDRTILSKQGASGQHEYALRVGNGGGETTASFYVFNTANGNYLSTASTTSIANDNKWHYVAGTVSGTTIKIYIDGNLEGTSSSTSGSRVTSSTQAFMVGGRADLSNYWKGFVDEPKVYGYARTAAQILADYNSRSAAKGASVSLGSSVSSGSSLSNGLVGYWKMDESSWNGTTGEVRDFSGNGNNGTRQADAAITTGKFGGGGSFDGSADSILVPTSSSLNLGSGPGSMFAWVYYTGGGQNPRIISFGNNSNWQLLINNSSSGNFQAYNINGALFDSGFHPSSNRWYHVGYTVSGAPGTLNFYVDGNKVATTAVTSIGSNNGLNLTIGSNANAPDSWKGNLDEVRIYNRGLSPADVTALYNFAPGPVAYYNFEEGSGSSVNDVSGNANTGTMTNGPTWVPGKYGSSGNFDGVNDYISAANSGTLTLTNNFTLSAWVNQTTRPSVLAPIISKEASNAGYYLWIGSTGLIHVGFNTGAQEITSNTAVSLNTWTYITGTWDGTTMNIYINGVLDKSTAKASNPATSNAALTIGTYYGLDGFYTGKVDEAKVYNYARTPAQIIQDMTGGGSVGGSGSSVSSSGLTGGSIAKPVGYWDFDEGYGTTANNQGNGGGALNGSLTNMAAVATSTSGWSHSGKFGKALNFDGSNDYVTMGNPSALNFDRASPFTISSWFKANSFSSTPYIYVKQNASSPYGGYGLYVKTTGVLVLDLTAASGGGNFRTASTASLSTGNWYHVVVAYDGSQTQGGVSFYINGVLSATSLEANTLASTIQSSASVNIGTYANGTGEFFNGSIDETKIYNFALTADQVKMDMNQGKSQVLGATSDNSSYEKNAANQEYCIPGDSTSCAAPVGKWDFEEGSGTTANDSSGSNNTGTLTNGPTYKPGKVGKSLSFDGTDDYVDTGNITALNSTAAVTYSAWIYDTGSSDTAAIVSKNNGATSSIDFLVRSSNELFARIGNGSNSFAITGASAYASNTWQFVTMVYNGAGATDSDKIKIYVNGVPQTLSITNSPLPTTTPSNSSTVKIGDYAGGPIYFKGKIDNVKIFNYARSAAQVAWDYNRGLPVAQYDLDECQGTVANDSSGNNNVGTITIGASGTQTSAGTCTTSSTAWGNGATGKLNASLKFDGVDDYVSVADNSALAPSTISVSAWIKSTSVSGEQTIAGKFYNQSGYKGWDFELFQSKILFDINTNLFLQGGTTLLSNTWYHVVGTYDGATIKVYVNGALDGTRASAVGITNPTGNLNIGRYTEGGSLFFNGQLDDIRIYNYPLTATQVKTLYNNGTIFYGPLTGTP